MRIGTPPRPQSWVAIPNELRQPSPKRSVRTASRGTSVAEARLVRLGPGFNRGRRAHLDIRAAGRFRSLSPQGSRTFATIRASAPRRWYGVGFRLALERGLDPWSQPGHREGMENSLDDYRRSSAIVDRAERPAGQRSNRLLEWNHSMTTSFTTKLIRPDAVGAWTFAPVPKKDAARAGFRARLRVKGTIDGIPFRSSLMPRGGGELFVVVNSEVRDRIGKSDGALVRLELELDASPVVVDVPPSLQRALDRDRSAEANFARFTASQRLAYSRWVAAAKQEATRDRRVGAAVEKIRRGEKLN
jgi:hypothetical protein